MNNNNNNSTYTLARGIYENIKNSYLTGLNPLSHLRKLGYDSFFKYEGRDYSRDNVTVAQVLRHYPDTKKVVCVVLGRNDGDLHVVIKNNDDCWQFTSGHQFQIKRDYLNLSQIASF